mgnify:CR=1 FL=1
MSKTLCMCFAVAVLVMPVSSKIGGMPLGLALTSWKWVLCERLDMSRRIDVDETRDRARSREIDT